ncbi:Mak10-domain-containing protein [Ascodesmis nigricans]|uniref:Mak10-domain-containing protein n=1 Tax=Ascodesmis nigricans TaxID=341454 RepID=A0A4S2N661_9PEZI|nr:Mak10-domain-containing protein [Ascodesmis nigricans]
MSTDTHLILQALSSLELNNEPSMASFQSSSPPALSDKDFRDITDEFNAASDKLEVGQLVKNTNFTLFQAVAALEIMDAKMDSGLLEPEYESFEAAKPREPEEIIGIMDRLLCHETAWHLGYALAQTLFTSLYIDKLLPTRPLKITEMTFGEYKGDDDSKIGKELVSEVLYPYCLALIKCCELVIRQIHQEHIYEEEDFITQTYGRRLLDFYEAEQISLFLDEAIQWLSKHEADFVPEVYKALKDRIWIRQRLLLGFSLGVNAPGSEVTEQWTLTQEMIESLLKTHSLAKPVDWAWSTSIQRKLASQVPPRPIIDIPFKDAVDKLKSACHDISTIPRIWEADSPSNVLSYFYHFMKRTHTPLPYVSSLLQTAFSKNGMILKKFRMHELVFEDLKDLCFPLEALLDERNKSAEAPHSVAFQIRQRMNWFGEHAGRSFFELFRILTQNRARLRRNLCHTILDWDTLQVEAEEVDNELKDLTNEKPQLSADCSQELFSFPLSSWVYYYKIRQMELIHLLGFELDIYQPHEFAGMYWYLQHYLRARISHLTRIRNFVAPNMKSAGQKNKEKEKSAEERAKRTYAWLNYLMMEGTVVHDLAAASTYLCTVMARLGLIKKPRQPYGTDELRYELRMKPFLTIGIPEVIPFEHFQIQVDMEFHDNSTLLEQARLSCADAKKHLQYLIKLDPSTARAPICEDDHKLNMSQLLRSCLGVGIAIMKLVGEVEEAGLGNATGESSEGKLDGVVIEWVREGYHKSFPVPNVKRG